MVIEVMGRDAGWIALEAGIVGGALRHFDRNRSLFSAFATT
jgi:6-phosphofructokinase